MVIKIFIEDINGLSGGEKDLKATQDKRDRSCQQVEEKRNLKNKRRTYVEKKDFMGFRENKYKNDLDMWEFNEFLEKLFFEENKNRGYKEFNYNYWELYEKSYVLDTFSAQAQMVAIIEQLKFRDNDKGYANRYYNKVKEKLSTANSGIK